MDYKAFFEIEGRKILLSDTVSVGNAIRRKTNIFDSLDTKNVTTLSPYDIARELVLAYEAIKNPGCEFLILENDAAAYYLDEVIADNRPAFIPERSLTIATVVNIYKTLSDIRLFSKTAEYERDSAVESMKACQVQKLIDEYELKLQSENLYDRPAVFKKAISILDSDTGEIPVDILIPWISNCTIGDLETNQRKGIEEEFTCLIKKIAGMNYAVECTMVEFMPYSGVEESKNNVTWNFFKAYGQVNEISHAIEIILNEANGAFDKYNIFYTSADYENFIVGLLEFSHIPYVFSSGFHAKNTSIVQLMLSLLDFIDSDYELEKLRPVIQNKALTYNLTFKDTRGINPGKGFSEAINAGIGWGLDRYKRYLASPQVVLAMAELDKLNEEEPSVINTACFARFLERIIDVFDEKNTIAEVYSKLLKLVKDYTFTKSTEYRELMGVLKEQCRVFDRLLGTRCPLMKDKIAYIREYLDKLTFEKRNGEVAVNISSIGGFSVLERENNFFLGLGAKQFAVNNIESAVMSDAEMEKYLSGANLPLAGEKNIKRQQQFKNTLCTLKEGKIYAGYCNYNTVDLRENAPSVIYMELLGSDTDGETISYDFVGSDVVVDTKEYIEILDAYLDGKNKDDAEEKFEAPKTVSNMQTTEALMSASALQKLLECPLKYYYSAIKKLSIPTKRVKNGHEWLPPMDRGNLFHRVAEEYMRQAMPPARPLSDKIDETLFDAIWNKQIAQMEAEVPWTSDAVKNKEQEEYREITHAYLEQMHIDWHADYSEGKKWEIIGCELDFEPEDNIIYEDDGADIVIKVKDADGTIQTETYQSSPYPYKIHFRKGQIDRLDGYVDEKGILQLRIIDYKTGSIESKFEEIEECIQIQHYVYALAALMHIRKLRAHDKSLDASLPNIFDRFPNISGVDFDRIAYEFPFEKTDKNALEVRNQTVAMLSEVKDENGNVDPFSRILTFPIKIRLLLRDTEGCRQSGHEDEISANVKEFLEEIYCETKKRRPGCAFCDYVDVCRYTCGGEKIGSDESDEV